LGLLTLHRETRHGAALERAIWRGERLLTVQRGSVTNYCDWFTQVGSHMFLESTNRYS
jgi:urease beta subunit